MKKTIIRVAMTATLFLCPHLLYAKGDISGVAVSKENGDPVAFATVQLIDSRTNKPLPIGTNTDENGRFVIAGVADGKYLVRVTNVGSVDQKVGLVSDDLIVSV